MHRSVPLALTLTAALAISACQASEEAATTAKSAAQAQSSATLSTTDATFINTVAMAGNAEVTFGQLAASKATRGDVRQFANRMVTDHTKGNQQLMALAQQKDITPSQGMDTMHQTLYEQLQAMSGSDFDNAYMKSQVQDHEMVVETFQTEADSGSDADVKGFAQQNLPTMQQHLQMARSISGM